MPQNYVLRCSLGDHPPGTVVPAYVVEVNHNHKRLLDLRLIEPTDKAVSAHFRPAPVAAVVPPDVDDMAKAFERELAANRQLARDTATLRGQLGEIEKKHDGLASAIAEYVITNHHLTETCKVHQDAVDAAEAKADALAAEVARLKGELDKANEHPKRGSIKEHDRLTAEITRLTTELAQAKRRVDDAPPM